MAGKFSLGRTKQCSTCPWKVGANPFDIPAYSEEKHKSLKRAIADPASLDFSRELLVMACHHSPEGREDHCIGWLHQQMGVGNNIALRLLMMDCTNLADVQVYGDQHETFEDTLPKN